MDIKRETIITGEKRGYRRGLILGLTMAESMLLLVFCLLLAAGAILISEKKTTNNINEENAALKKELERVQKQYDEASKDLIFLQEKISEMPNMEQRPLDEWRELTIAKQQVEQLAEAELSLAELIENAKAVKTVVEKKLTAEDVETAQTVVEKLKAVTQDRTTPAPEELDDIINVTKTLQAHRQKSETSLTEELEEVIRRAAMYVEEDGTDMPHEWPPIINLSEADRHFFRSGSAELSKGFEQVLTDSIAQQIAQTATKYAVDVIEVIGHTDEQRMGRRASNLDEDIKNVLSGKSKPSALQPADNAGLGLARAIAVAEVLRRDPALQQFTILPMSGAQLILPGDVLMDGSQAGDVASRRRIEIRVRKRNELAQTLAN